MHVFTAEEVRRFFFDQGIDKEIHTFEESTENAYLAARALGVQLGQIVKSILFLADGEPVLILMSGDMNVHNKKLKKLLGARKVKIADSQTVLAATGYEVGGVPPVAHRQKIPVYLDKSLERFSEIYPAAGAANNMFATTFQELAGLTGAEIVEVATPKKKT
ncbi:MAG: YbaK/EbsC family protein [Deltaproteobacteria bacterium]|nr:YbaK/EbsC family protein [Deltaproteobacteria bacterium]MBW2072263.1 YbaK/EbsC family protein [Deltaproteobacteria bacterium]